VTKKVNQKFLPEKIRNFSSIFLKKSKFFVNLLRKDQPKFLGNLLGKIDLFLAGSTTLPDFKPH